MDSLGSTFVAPLHLGGLHPYETVMLGILAFGPFVVLAVVVAVLRRRDAREGTDAGVPETDRRA